TRLPQPGASGRIERRDDAADAQCQQLAIVKEWRRFWSSTVRGSGLTWRVRSRITRTPLLPSALCVERGDSFTAIESREDVDNVADEDRRGISLADRHLPFS